MFSGTSKIVNSKYSETTYKSHVRHSTHQIWKNKNYRHASNTNLHNSFQNLYDNVRYTITKVKRKWMGLLRNKGIAMFCVFFFNNFYCMYLHDFKWMEFSDH